MGRSSECEDTLPSFIFLFDQLRHSWVAILRCPAQDGLVGPGLQLKIMLAVVETGPDRLQGAAQHRGWPDAGRFLAKNKHP